MCSVPGAPPASFRDTRKALRSFLADLRRDFTRNRFRRFGQGLVIAAEYAAAAVFPLCAFHPHTGFGGALCRADDRAELGCLGPCA